MWRGKSSGRKVLRRVWRCSRLRLVACGARKLRGRFTYRDRGDAFIQRRADGARYDFPHCLDDEAHNCRGCDDPGRRNATSGSTIQSTSSCLNLRTARCCAGSTLRSTTWPPAKRVITLRDLLTFRWGFGAVMAWPLVYPIQKAMEAAGLMPGPDPVEQTPDDYMRRLGALPLMHQPGEQWMYHTGSDVLGVLIAQASGQSFADFLRERVFAP
jgi:Beta-lactamase